MMSTLPLFYAAATWFFPLWRVAAGATAVLMLLWLLGLGLRAVLPIVAAIAQTTAKEVFYQPLLYVLLAIGIFVLILSDFLPYNTFGEDIKMVKDQGLTLITIFSLILALWTASVSVADEIEGRTALTLLSKPVSRRQFVIGKFLGILVPVIVMFVVLGSVFLGCLSFKVVYDARELALPDPGQRDCITAMVQIVPGLILSFMEAVVLTSIAVAVATRLPMLPNLVICSAVYVLGHLVPLLLTSSMGRFEIVGFVARLFTTILPVLDHFNIQAAISAGKEIPLELLLWDGLYCVLYSTVAMLFALLLFEDRDLA